MLWVCAVVEADEDEDGRMISTNASEFMILVACAMDQERPTSVDVKRSQKETAAVAATNSTRWACVVVIVLKMTAPMECVMIRKFWVHIHSS